MFTYSEKFNTKKWFLTKHEELIDLNQIRYLKIEVEDEDGKEDRKFLVRADCFDILAICDTELEAKEYIKDIYNFLIAE